MDKNVNYEINSKTELILKLLIAFSCSILTIILSTRFYMTGVIVGAIFSLGMSILILFGSGIKITTINKRNFVLSCIISCYIMKVFLSFINVTIHILTDYFNTDINIIKTLLGILALPALIFVVYKFIEAVIPKVKKFLNSLTNVEIQYIQIIFIIAVILSFFTIYTTTAFSKPNRLDVIYTSDTGDLMYKDVFCNISHNENDLRQPLFGVFALPFGVLAKIISEFVFFIPNNYEYEFVMTVFQFLISTITTILIARLLKIEEKDKKYLYMLFSFSFPYIIFNLVLEQYVIALFYLILTIYLFCNYDKVNYAYIGAAGTLVTSGILFPFITKFKNVKQYIKDILECLIIFIATFIISGQFTQVLTFEKTMTSLLGFAKPLPLTNKIYQFLNFVQAIFFSCKGEVVENRYWLQEIETASVIGLVMLIIVIVSAIINRKEFMAKISIFWVLFSIILLVGVGWGTTENGLILYSLYFAWSYLCLFYLFLKKLFKNRKVFITIILLTTLIMAIFNLREFLNIMIFGIRYY